MSTARMFGGPREPMPVTVLSGADRLLVGQIAAELAHRLPGSRVLVDAMVDADAPPGLPGEVVRPEVAGRVRCATCLLRERLLGPLARAAWGGADHVVLVASGVVAPRSVVAALTADPHARLGLGHVARLERLVSVVDCRATLRAMADTAALGAAAGPAGPADLPVAELVAEQLEVADVVLAAGGTAEERRHLGWAVRALNPGSTLRPLDGSAVERILAGPPSRPGREPAWEAALSGRPAPPGWRRYGADRPFDPDRLHELLAGGWRALLRAKGWTWLASAPQVAVAFSQAGAAICLTPQQRWAGGSAVGPWAPAEPRAHRVARPRLVPAALDRVRTPAPGQHLVLHAPDALWAQLRRDLDACLIS